MRKNATKCCPFSSSRKLLFCVYFFAPSTIFVTPKDLQSFSAAPIILFVGRRLTSITPLKPIFWPSIKNALPLRVGLVGPGFMPLTIWILLVL